MLAIFLWSLAAVVLAAGIGIIVQYKTEGRLHGSDVLTLLIYAIFGVGIMVAVLYLLPALGE
jgi:hypothetical protein